MIQDGCSSHISLALIDLAKQNDIDLLCLPSHTTHVLQPLDIGVFSSLKHHFGIALNAVLKGCDARVPTSEDIPGILAEAWPKSMTPVNLMSGFRRTGIFSLNPSYIHDKVCAPSLATHQDEPPAISPSGSTSSNNKTLESIADSLENHAFSKSPGSSLSSAMENFFLKPVNW